MYWLRREWSVMVDRSGSRGKVPFTSRRSLGHLVRQGCPGHDLKKRISRRKEARTSGITKYIKLTDHPQVLVLEGDPKKEEPHQ